MRFIEDGPSIPNELLSARDEGQVIFFCGSGVSLAKTLLPNFYGLADQVLDHLHASADSRARAVIAASKAVNIQGVEGLIPADRAFSILEQEFDTKRVRDAVAKSLVPRTDDLSAHRALLDLSRGTDGEVRLVTTNFDRLFERCDPTVGSHAPPDLPRPSRPASFKGIMHLHGVLDEEGRAPLDDDFVVSSGDFGRAYLSEGWATQFIRSLMERFQIVFVGYTANDPPVQYLLEALNTRSATLQPMYAFQAGDDDLAKALWEHKGVIPIHFDPAEKFRALWETIDAWAERARDPQAWERRQLEMAAAGPQTLRPYQRGIITHIASTPSGSRAIAKAGAALPAEWLCVFDPGMRFRTPAQRTILDDKDVFDPFEAWSIDDDVTPPPILPGNRIEDRKIPPGAANPLLAERRDEMFDDRNMGPSAGLSFEPVGRLPDRLGALGSWITQIAHEPVALWWAAGKLKINSTLGSRISNALDREPARFPDTIRSGWRQVLASQDRPEDPHDLSLYAFDEMRKAEGWSPSLIRRYADLRTPRLVVRQSWTRGGPPGGADANDLLYRDIKYPNAAIDFEIPQELDEQHLRALGFALERAIDLETELRGTIYLLGPLVPDTQPDDLPDTGDNLTTLFRDWIAILERILETDVGRVRAEVMRWDSGRNNIGRRIRIWSSTALGLLSVHEAAEQLLGLDNDGFWERDHQRDLLHALLARWHEFDNEDRAALENRIRAGPEIYEGEVAEAYPTRAAAYALERIEWLHNQGCGFTFDYDEETRRLNDLFPSWKAGEAGDAAASNEIRAYSVGQQTAYDDLLDIPVVAISTVALGLDHHRADFKTVLRPFLGLAREKPVRALAALRRANGQAALRLWEDFLLEDDRPALAPRLVTAIACVLADLADNDLIEILRPVARWVERWSGQIFRQDHALEERLWERLLDVIDLYPDDANSAVVTSGDNHDWLLEAINAPSGRLAEFAVHAASTEAPEGELPARWLGRLRRLTSLPGNAGRYAIVTATQFLGFLDTRVPNFVEEKLLPARHGNDDDQAAFWTGVYRARGLTAGLHRKLNADIIQAARNAGSMRGENTSLSALLLRGWTLNELRESGDAISDEVLRETILATSEEFRRQLLQTIRRSWSSDGWPDRAIYLLRHVWPRQRVARSAAVSDAVASLIVDAGARLPDALDAAGDLLEAMPGMLASWSHNIVSLKELGAQFPTEILDFLSRVLAEDAASWPYRIEQLIGALEETTVATDSRLQELRRRWSARAG